MLGVIVDCIGILLGTTIGFLAKKVIPESWNDIVMKGLGLVSIYMGVDGALVGENSLIAIIAIVIGAMIGEGLQISQRFDRLAARAETYFDRKGSKSNFAQRFIIASLQMCVGAMAVMGALDAGLRGDYSLLFAKTAIDFTGGMMFAASLGVGVIFAAIPVFLFEGSITMLASYLEPVLTVDVINEMTCIGSILIIAMGLNLVADTKLKIMNFMPAVFLPIVLCPLFEMLPM